MAEAGGRAAPLTVGDHDAANHGAKHHRQGERLEAQRRHVAPGREGPVFLLQGRKRKEGFEMREPHPLLPASPSEPARALCGGPSRPRAMGCGPAACPEAQATPPSACEPALRLGGKGQQLVLIPPEQHHEGGAQSAGRTQQQLHVTRVWLAVRGPRPSPTHRPAAVRRTRADPKPLRLCGSASSRVNLGSHGEDHVR